MQAWSLACFLCAYMRHVLDTLPRITMSLEFAVNSAVSPLGLQKRIYSYCETSQEMLLCIGLSLS